MCVRKINKKRKLNWANKQRDVETKRECRRESGNKQNIMWEWYCERIEKAIEKEWKRKKMECKHCMKEGKDLSCKHVRGVEGVCWQIFRTCW